MNFTLERVASPDIEPVTLAEMIQHVREYTSIGASTQTELTKLIVAGREWAEDFTGRALIDQTWCLTLQDLVGDPLPSRGYSYQGSFGFYQGSWSWTRRNEILLRKAPALAVLSVMSVDSAGNQVTINPATYQIREAKSKYPRLVALSGSWPTVDLKVTFRAGFADRLGSPQQGAEMVPERFKHAIKLWVEANYDRDKDMMSKLVEAAECMLKPERSDISLA